MNYESSFLETMSKAGFLPAENLSPFNTSGQIQRFRVQGDKHATKNGWYRLNKYGNFLSGVFGCNKRLGPNHWITWSNIGSDHITHSERQDYLRKIEQEKAQQKNQEKTNRYFSNLEAWNLWQLAISATDDHPFLMKKNVQAFGIRQLNDDLLIPLHDIQNEFQGYQKISPNGQKRFSKGAVTHASFFCIGEPQEYVYVAEGYATAASLFKHTGRAVIIAFSASNLTAAAVSIRRLLPYLKITIAADNDRFTPGNPGITEANKAVATLNSMFPAFLSNIIFPIFPLDVIGTDFNDFFNLPKNSIQQVTL